MCYEAAQLAYRIYRDAVRLKATEEEIDELRKRWEELEKSHVQYYHVGGFSHPKFMAFTSVDGKLNLDHYYWGLIPHWVKDEEQAKELWNKTLNARGESLAEKPSFRDAFETKRCLIPLDGFYEHFHKGGSTFPHYIQSKNDLSLFVGGLYSNWLNKETGEILKTFTIVTTKANKMMSEIHNNPKLSEARMPLLLDDDSARNWLENDQSDAEKLVDTNISIDLKAHTVQRLRGSAYVGNTPEVQNEFVYDELNDPPELF